MNYDIQSVDHASEFLTAVTGDTLEALLQSWFICGEDIDKFIKLYSTQIANWDIETTDFVIKHVTSSCCELKDIRVHGILYLPDVIKADTFLSRLLNKADFVIDVDAHKLNTAGQEYELDWDALHEQPWSALFREELIQISRTLYHDYTSTFLHCANPFAYGNGLGRHPEFMDYFARIPPNGKRLCSTGTHIVKDSLLQRKSRSAKQAMFHLILRKKQCSLRMQTMDINVVKNI